MRAQLRARGYVRLTSAPATLLDGLRCLALGRYHEVTGHAWDSTAKSRRRRREVLPAELPGKLVRELCAWLHTFAEMPGLPDTFARAFAAHKQLHQS